MADRVQTASRFSLSRASLALATIALLSLVVLSFSSPLHRELLTRSLVLAGSAGLLSTIWGTMLALCLARARFPGRSIAIVLVIAGMLLPLYVHLAAWDAMLGSLGWLSVATAAPDRPWMSGITAAIWIHSLALLPWSTLLVLVRLASIDPRLEEQALLEMSETGVLVRVTLPRVASAMAMSMVWGMVATVGEMTVTNVYLVNTFTEHLYSRLALAAGLEEILPSLAPLLAMLVLAVSSLFWVTSQLNLAEVQNARRPVLLITSGLAKSLAIVVVVVSLGAITLVPVTNLLSQAGLVVLRNASDEPMRTWSALAAARVVLETPSQFYREFQWSIALAVQAASAGWIVALLIAWIASRVKWGWILLALLCAIGLGMPGPVVGMMLSLVRGESRGSLAYLMDHSMLMPVIAQSFRIVPLVALLLWQTILSIDTRKIDAAMLDGYSSRGAVAWLLLSERRIALGSAWLLGVAISWGELSCSFLALPPSVDTITRRLFGLVHYGVDQQVAGISLVMLVAYIGVAALLWRVVQPPTAR